MNISKLEKLKDTLLNEERAYQEDFGIPPSMMVYGPPEIAGSGTNAAILHKNNQRREYSSVFKQKKGHRSAVPVVSYCQEPIFLREMIVNINKGDKQQVRV